MYSIAGFDPCYPFDFSKPKEIKFFVNCRDSMEDAEGINIRSENVGYQYRDVIIPAEKPQFTYLASNPRNQYKLVKQTDMTVHFSLFNWKWLSEISMVVI